MLKLDKHLRFQMLVQLVEHMYLMENLKEMPHVPHHGHTRKRFAQDASRQYGLFSMTCFSRFNKYESDLILGIKVMKQTNKDNKGSLCQAREREK